MNNLQGFLKGLGLGLIMSSILLSFSTKKETKQLYGDKYIIEKAKELGMITQTQYLEKISSLDKDIIISKAKALGMDFNNATNISEKANKNVKIINEEDKTKAKEESNTKEIISVKITNGMTSNSIAKLLYSKGVIESIDDFLTYINKKNLARKLRIGIYDIEKGSSLKEIADIITK